MALELFSDWSKRMIEPSSRAETASVTIVPKAVGAYAGQLTFVQNLKDAEGMRDLILQRPVAYVGIDFEFRYSRAGVLMKRVDGRDFHWYDPRSIQPMLLGLTWVEPTSSTQAQLLRFVVDVRNGEALGAVRELLTMPIPHVAHFAQAEFFCLLALGLPLPSQVWDSWVAERAMDLGRQHRKYLSNGGEDPAINERAEADKRVSYSLVATCLRRGIDYAFTGDKERLQRSFLDHSTDKPFSREQIEYASADATAAAGLYPVQVQAAVLSGCLHHLQSVEMPWTRTNAGIIWNGVRVDPGRIQELASACDRQASELGDDLRKSGLANANSHPQLSDFFEKQDLLHLFQQGNSVSFDDDHLEAAEKHHPAISKIRTLRKIQRLRSDRLFTGDLVGADGRLHPDHRQLGTDSGRNSMRWPNIGGIGRALRPIVVPDHGNVIGDVDLSQIEVGIAAAFYGDPELIRMFNGRDVYVAMAKRYYAGTLSEKDTALADKVFKKKFSSLRDTLKVYTLGIIYGISPHGLSVLLGISLGQADQEQKRFLSMFPALTKALHEAVAYGAIRGYAQTCSGLRRYRGRAGRPNNWESNWLRNTPIQASAGVVFKVAGNRLHQRYQHYGAKIILPMHDAFVFECPRNQLQKVAKLTSEVMRGAVQEYFPMLEPMADINITDPSCWNKDGKSRSLRLWMIEPSMALRR